MVDATRSDPAPPLLCFLLAGSGARAVFQAGALEELYQHRQFRHPTIFAGTSGGAINAALLAAGKTPEQLRDFWLRFAAEPPVDANTAFVRTTLRALGGAVLRHGLFDVRADRGGSLWWAAKRAWRHRVPDPGNLVAFLAEMLLTRNYGVVSDLMQDIPDPALLHAQPLREMLVAELGGEVVLARPGVRLAVNAIDIRRCRPARFVNFETPLMKDDDEYVVTRAIDVDMVIGSSAIPFLLPAMTVGTRRLWDGGPLVNTPLATAIALGAETIVPILANALPDGTAELRNLGDAVQRLVDVIVENCFNLDRKLLLERNRLARNPPPGGPQFREIALYEAIRPGRNAVFDTGSYFNFSKQRLLQMYEEGRTNARAWVAQGSKLAALPPG